MKSISKYRKILMNRKGEKENQHNSEINKNIWSTKFGRTIFIMTQFMYRGKSKNNTMKNKKEHANNKYYLNCIEVQFNYNNLKNSFWIDLIGAMVAGHDKTGILGYQGCFLISFVA